MCLLSLSEAVDTAENEPFLNTSNGIDCILIEICAPNATQKITMLDKNTLRAAFALDHHAAQLAHLALRLARRRPQQSNHKYRERTSTPQPLVRAREDAEAAAAKTLRAPTP